MKRTATLIVLTCASVALGGCSALDAIGDKIDKDCEEGAALTTTQSYLDTFNDGLAAKGRKFRIDGITCLE